VWAYAITQELPYNPVYDRLAALGVPLERRRVAALTCFRATRFGSHVWIRAGWPDLFNQLAHIFPLVRGCS
jgi:phosphoadenosine phosphosulfate reductase